LPYVDDSEAVSPISEENNVHGCLADSLSGMATVAGQVSHSATAENTMHNGNYSIPLMT
jgi:hypothetical protein